MDLMTSLEAQGDRRQVTVLGRRSNAVHFTGRQLLESAEQTLDMWATCLGPGKHVLIAALPAGEGFLVSLVASLIGGGTLVPVAPPRPSDPPGRLLRMARTCGATAVLCTSSNQPAVEAQLCDADGSMSYPVLAIDRPEPSKKPFRPKASFHYPIIQHTSGSTRFPKSVPITASQIRENCGLIQSLWGMNAGSVMVNWLPHYHDMGLMGCIVYPLLSGAHSVQMSPYDMIRRPLSWLKAISDYKGTISGGPTFAFRECLERIQPEDSRDLDLRPWQRAFCGAEPVPAGLLDRFRGRFASNGLRPEAVFPCYGMAECTLFAAGEAEEFGQVRRAVQVGLAGQVGRAGEAEKQPAPVPKAWQAVDGCLLSEQIRANIRICDPETRAECPDGTSGEIWLSGASLCDGYLSNLCATDESFHVDPDGRRWLRTGDLGGVAGQHLYITGRIKEIVIVNGRNVAAAEIEWIAARAHDDLNASAAAAFANGRAGRAHLCIETRPGAAAPQDPEKMAAQIRSSVAGSCGVLLDVVTILPRGTLPRTSSGKIKRQLVAKEFNNDTAASWRSSRSSPFEVTS